MVPAPVPIDLHEQFAVAAQRFMSLLSQMEREAAIMRTTRHAAGQIRKERAKAGVEPATGLLYAPTLIDEKTQYRLTRLSSTANMLSRECHRTAERGHGYRIDIPEATEDAA